MDKKICYKCMQEMGLKVPFPHLLETKHGCDICGSKKESWMLAEVNKQQLRNK